MDWRVIKGRDPLSKKKKKKGKGPYDVEEREQMVHGSVSFGMD